MKDPQRTQIRASAGAGKTWRLTGDYIQKLADVYRNVDNARLAALASTILAVTFTNAAANEMRSRVLNRLKESALGQEKYSEQARRWLEAFLADPAALNIRTIDSVLNQIVRASALDLNIPPDYEIEFDAKSALAPYVDAVFEQARGNGREQALLRKACIAVLDNSKGGFLAQDRIVGPLSKVLGLALQGEFDNLATIEEIDRAREDLVESVRSSAAHFLDLAGDAKWKNARYKGSIARYAEGDFTKSPSTALGKKLDELLKDAPSAALERAWSEFVASARTWYAGDVILARGRHMSHFIDLAKRVVEEFRAGQEEAGIALQQLVPGWASQVLAPPGGVSDALCRMGSRLTHFLVDEFQDTSDEQWKVLHALVLEALSRGGSFTWVGDIKQSIYGWRGGDPRLFDAALRDAELSAIAPVAKTDNLKDNWRSLPAIVEHTNRFFGPLADGAGPGEVARLILGSDADAAVVAETAERIQKAFQDVTQVCRKTDGLPGYVAAMEYEGSDEKPALIDEVARLLLDDIGLRRPWSDVLILVRSNDAGRELAEKLGEHRIPVITENGLLLAENGLIIQTLAFLEFLNSPVNDVAFWTFINGSIFREHQFAKELKAVDLAAWAAGRDEKTHLYQQFRDDFPKAWEAVIRPFLYRSLVMTAYDVARELYNRLDVEQRFPEDQTMLRRFLETLHIAENSGKTTIPAFLEYWQAHSTEEKAPMPENMNAVRIMTIHKAKGLEAQVVIVPGAAYGIQADNNPVVLEAGGARVVATYLKAEGAIYDREIARQGLEALNLLYVALTRAEEELYVLVKKKKGGLAEIIPYLLEKAKLALPYMLGKQAPAKPGHTPCFMEAAIPEEAQISEAEDSDDWKPMAWMPGLKIYHAELRTTALTPTQRGTVLHSCLERMAYAGDAQEIADAALRAGVSGSAISVPESELPDLLAGLKWFVEKMPGQDWMARGWREHPLMNAEGEMLRADLIVPEPWGPLVVDYKTGIPRPKDIAQIREYMATLAASGQFPGAPCGLLVYLDKRQFIKVPFKRRINLAKATDGGSDADLLLTDTLPVLP